MTFSFELDLCRRSDIADAVREPVTMSQVPGKASGPARAESS
jgi:hypothetical protein